MRSANPGVSTKQARCDKTLGSLSKLFAKELQADAAESRRKKSKNSLDLRAHNKFFHGCLGALDHKVFGWRLGSFLPLRQVAGLPDGARRYCTEQPDELTGGQRRRSFISLLGGERGCVECGARRHGRRPMKSSPS